MLTYFLRNLESFDYFEPSDDEEDLSGEETVETDMETDVDTD